MSVAKRTENGMAQDQAAQLVIDLLDYVDQVEKLKTKPLFSIPDEFYKGFQHELKGLVEVQYNVQDDGDDTWLRVPRLLEEAPPSPPQLAMPWVVVSRSPAVQPILRTDHPTPEECDAWVGEHPEVPAAFEDYLQNAWTPWSEREGPRRKTIAQYNKLFALQQAMATDGAETPLDLVWGIGFAAWKHPEGATPVRFPLLTQSCEISLDPESFELNVRPRDVQPRLELDNYIELGVPGVQQLEAFWRSNQANGGSANRINPFEPSTFESVLKAAVTYLDVSGTYLELVDDTSPPKPEDSLQVSNTWVLFAKRRSADPLLEDVRRLKSSVEASAAALPKVVAEMVSPGDDAVRRQPEQAFRGLSTGSGNPAAMELYFPLPYNDEQVSVVQKLEHNDGVVVQGPPGTGKSHTIANIICHYLAQGKRVLVTSKGETALSVLRDKLPKRVQPLSVALLVDERDGMRQFEHAIQTISATISDLRPAQAESTIAELSHALDRLHGQIHVVDEAISTYAAKHLQAVQFQGREVLPDQLAKQVLEQADEHGWFDDKLMTPPGTPVPLGDDAIRELRTARIEAAERLRHLHDRLPAADSLPGWTTLHDVHRALTRARALDKQVQMGDVLPLADHAPSTYDQARELQRWLAVRQRTIHHLHTRDAEWAPRLELRLRALQNEDKVLVDALRAQAHELLALEAQRKTFITEAIEVPPTAILTDDLQEALSRLTEGKSAFFLPFGKAGARQVIDACRVQGAAPKSAQAWARVQAVFNWRESAQRALAKWGSVAAELGIPAHDEGTVEARIRASEDDGQFVLALTELVLETEPQWPNKLRHVFPEHATTLQITDDAHRHLVETSVSAHLERERLASAAQLVQGLQTRLHAHSGQLVERLQAFLDNDLGQPQTDESVLQRKWVDLQRELLHLSSLQPAFGAIKRVTQSLHDAGAVKWSNKLRIVPASDGTDPLTPGSWMDAWEWRQAYDFLERIDQHQQLHKLFARRKALSTSLAKTYQDLVAEKTWLGVYNNSPSSVRQALQAYMNAVHAMGRGTGVRAVRFRKNARDAMSRAYLAVPCWVLPHWRVSETLPAELGLFDLVIVDEASQSDISALPCLMRAKKVLVVGDHKQVSPSAVGTAEGQITDLVHRFLSRQPHGSEMTPDKSIYDLARVVFAGNAIMLKEHFRSVPAIIEYSNREFYQGSIRPLRVPKANERLDPPLIDVFVQGARREGDVNKAEAHAILADIQDMLRDPALTGRSIGVVTLVGTKQAKYIHELVHRAIAPADIVTREIAVGPPPMFQGRERDIMLVSLVLGPTDRPAADRLDMQQRYNVALSRARDRMILYRSVAPAYFREDSLTGRLLHHFQHPFQRDVQKTAQLRERCESPFECEIFDALTQRGYRVEPQVACGGFFIDMVVEGAEGRRLAVECDGDKYHGPGKWDDDMRRQRILERAGWTFWRSFASSFLRQREEVLADLFKTLTDLGIEPIGADALDTSVWVQHREVDPFRVRDEAEDETT